MPPIRLLPSRASRRQLLVDGNHWAEGARDVRKAAEDIGHVPVSAPHGIWTILIGFVAGLIAKAITPGNHLIARKSQ